MNCKKCDGDIVRRWFNTAMAKPILIGSRVRVWCTYGGGSSVGVLTWHTTPEDYCWLILVRADGSTPPLLSCCHRIEVLP